MRSGHYSMLSSSSEIGLDPAAVRAWAVESPLAFRRKWYFAEAGLMDHADPNALSPEATAAL